MAEEVNNNETQEKQTGTQNKKSGSQNKKSGSQNKKTNGGSKATAAKTVVDSGKGTAKSKATSGKNRSGAKKSSANGGATNTSKLGPFELRGELGRGAMAKVWRGWDPNLEREVAIKEPLFDDRLSEDVLAEMSMRFVKEGKAAAKLNHPGIVTIYAADVYEGRPAIVMELIDGITLADLLDKGAMQPGAALDALDQLLDAVGYAHSQGVVHRDIKPDNIFITKDGRVKLGDFGIAHIEDGSMTRKTQVGQVLGTPGYMAPEQATGAAIDSRTDLFSIGTIAYEMITGDNPFGAGSSDATTLLYRIVHEPVAELPESAVIGLPDDIRPAILAALNKNPNDRPQDAETFKAMLHGGSLPAYKGGSTASGQSSALGTSAQKASSAPKWVPYVAVVAACVVVIAIIFFAANSGMIGGGGGMVTDNTGTESGVETPAYLIDEGGLVTVYLGTIGGSANKLHETTDIKVSGLRAETQAELAEGVSVDGITAAENKIAEYRTEAQEILDEEKAAGAAFLIDQNGKVAIYYGTIGSTSELYEITDVETSELSSTTASLLKGGVQVANVAAAEALIAEYELEIENMNAEHTTFSVIPGKMTWYEARDYCERNGGWLATISDATEYQQVLQVAESSGKTFLWLGGYKDGSTWKWNQGQNVSFTSWAPEEPNNSGGVEDRIALIHSVKFGEWDWFDVPADVGNVYREDIMGFVMEKPGQGFY